jgi:hypothetical protein
VQLDRIELALRQRSPWEALDLGSAMLRAWSGPVLRAWFGTYLPVAAALFLFLSPEWAALALWWLKPVFDRVLLFVYGRAAFGAAPSLREVYRELPGLLRRSGLVAGLTLQRFSMVRSFVLPVVQLEGLRGKAARARRRVLGARTSGHAVWLTLVLIHVSVVLGFSLVVLADWLSPVDAPSLFDWRLWLDDEAEPWMLFLLNAAFIAADTLVEPLYVACGFGLYLNRRTELEGWDIELDFRRMAARLQGRPALAVLLALVVAGALLPEPGPAWAAPPTTMQAAPSLARQTVDAVLADPVFGREVPDTAWRYRGNRADEDRALPSWLKWLEGFAEWMAASLRLLVYGLLALVAGAVLFLLYRHRARLAAARHGRAPLPQTLFGLDLRPDSLPVDLAAAARAELAAGRSEAALSLLYRGALVALIHRAGVEFRSGDTEDDCELRVSGRIDGAAFAVFRELLAAWRATAYGHFQPDRARLERLCDSWDTHFGAHGRGAEAAP